jgi:hypothetical protein
MKKINHNAKENLQTIGIILIILFILIVGGKLDQQQENESKQLSKSIEANK